MSCVGICRKSIHMKRYLATLKPLIDQHRLSVASINLHGFDKIAGFAGIHLHDEYAELFFMNMCLGYTKGLAASVYFLRVNEFAVAAEAAIPALLQPVSPSSKVIIKASTVVVPTTKAGPMGDKTWISGAHF
jgi:hypothetical protein